ncbi:MAG TPA: ABC transporter substrate-binding protein [Planctomycetota bacterium]|nr:ABC transporter substrate-binding protein [Planctomycetota bacterium]
MRALLPLLVALGAVAGEAREYTIGMSPWIAWAPMHVAESRGIWERLGVRVRVVNHLGEQEHIAAVAGGRVDLTMEMIGSVVGLVQDGTPMTILAELDWSHGGDKLIARTTDALARGSTIGVYRDDPAILMFLSEVLRGRGLALADIVLAEYDCDALVAQFIAGRLPAIAVYDPHTLVAIRDGGGVAIASSAIPVGCMPEGLAGRQDLVAAIPRADLARIILGWMLACDWCARDANWADYARIVNQRTFDGAEHGEEDLRAMLSVVRLHDAATLRERHADDGGLRGFVGACERLLVDNQRLVRPFTAAGMIDTAALDEALALYDRGLGRDE